MKARRTRTEPSSLGKIGPELAPGRDFIQIRLTYALLLKTPPVECGAASSVFEPELVLILSKRELRVNYTRTRSKTEFGNN